MQQRVSDEAVRLFTISKWGWIKRQQTKFDTQERQTTREFVTGESHYYLGNRYPLDVEYHAGPPSVVIRNKKTMDLIVRLGSIIAQREHVLLEWYRHQLKGILPAIITKWETTIDVQVAEWGVKKMKTKWGTCNIAAQRIWLNLELIKKPQHCIEYVTAHELVHLLERHHNDRFNGFMTHFMPQWRHYRDDLNRAPLGHESWESQLSED
ncbi:MAG: M48 family metallopeptidase [Ktedonobacterales bacterium]|nr:M48 family metallopeptidase [Ktedonobacterales bacterium]